MTPKPSCWIISDGRPGMVNQCLGLAEALGLEPVVKKVNLRSPWRQLSPLFLRVGKRWSLHTQSDHIDPPWPDILIGTGRHSVLASLRVRQHSPRTFRVQVQNPAIALDLFDYVIAPRHDGLEAANVLSTRGSLHRITQATLDQGCERWRTTYAPLPQPRVAVLIGGPNGAYKMGPEDTYNLAQQLSALVKNHGAGLMVTASFRTGAQNEAILRQALEGPGVSFWDGKGDNPYFGLLGLADAIITTPDSVNMVSEAASTGKPVYVAMLPGGSAKFDAFHRSLLDEGVTRIFKGNLEQWQYQPLNDTLIAANEIRRRSGLEF
jgi:uncharacterized protein